MTLQRFFTIIKRRAFFVCLILAIGLALMFVFRNAIPNSYIGVSHVVLVAETGTRDPSVGIVDLPSIATSTVVLERVRNKLRLPVSLVNFKAAAGASVLGRSSIMAVSFRDMSAERAIEVSNTLADELSRYYDEISTQRYNGNVDRLSDELTNESVKIRAVETKIGAIVARNPFVASDQSVATLTTQLGTLSAQRADAFAKLQGDRAIADALAPSSELSKTARHEILAGDPVYSAIRTVAAKDSAQLASQQAGYTKDFPGLPGAIAKVNAENRYAERVANRALSDPNAFSASEVGTAAQRAHQTAVVAGDEAQVRQLDAVIAPEQAAFKNYPESAMLYDQLRSERDALQSEYNALAQRRATSLANRAEASSLGSVVVLDHALKADTQLTGGRSRAAVLTFILVLALALGAAFLAESLDPRIRRAEEVEELYGIPVVARFGA